MSSSFLILAKPKRDHKSLEEDQEILCRHGYEFSTQANLAHKSECYQFKLRSIAQEIMDSGDFHFNA